jgi:hypothetical protein
VKQVSFDSSLLADITCIIAYWRMWTSWGEVIFGK